jgi:hypothetical protein
MESSRPNEPLSSLSLPRNGFSVDTDFVNGSDDVLQLNLLD